MDYNNDGKKDIVVGEGAGRIRVYLNTNTDADPQFGNFSYVQVGSTTFDIGDYSAPYVFDWDNDGKQDVLCGDMNGYVHLLINTGTASNPAYSSAVYLYDGAVAIDVSSRSAPVIFDWDGDGKNDLLIGNSAGKIRFYPNVGTNSAPVYDGYSKLQCNGADMDCGGNTCFDLVDWTNDGMTDVIAGCESVGGAPTGPVYYYRAIYLPVVDAKVNGQDGPLNVPKSTPLEFKIALEAGSLAGVQHDWWVWVERGNSKWWCQYNGGARKWTKSVVWIRFAAAGLLDVNGYTVLGPRTIPAGTWYYRFAIDELDNTWEGTYLDEVEIVTY